MKARMLFTMLLSLTARISAASDSSPFYRNQFVITEREACARGAALAEDSSPFYRNQFVRTRAEDCAAAATRDAAARRSSKTGQHCRDAAPVAANPVS